MYDDIVGIDAFKEWVAGTRTTYPDFNMTIVELVSKGDRFVYRWTANGTNTGPGDSPPTGKKVDFSGVNFAAISNGEIVEEWVYFNRASVLTQLGFAISPPATE